MLGKFIVFEGGEGCGKTTQVKLLAKALKKQGKKVLVTHEPGSTEIADQIRQIIVSKYREDTFARTELLLFLASRAQHVEKKIIPALKKGYYVICDRFSGSTLAYQIGARKLEPVNLIKKMDAFARQDLEPDMVLYLDIDPKKALARKVANQQELNRLDKEKIKFHQDVRKYFLKLSKKKNWKKINADREIKEVDKDIQNAIKNL